MNTSDLTDVLRWRNHPDIRRHMYRKSEISITEHKDWFFSSLTNDLKHLMIFEWRQKSSGFVSFAIDPKNNTACWGFYISPDIDRNVEVNKNIAVTLGNTAIDYGFNHLCVEKIIGEVIEHNQSSKKFHEKLGFTKVREIENQYFNGNDHYTVVVYEIKRNNIG